MHQYILFRAIISHVIPKKKKTNKQTYLQKDDTFR